MNNPNLIHLNSSSNKPKYIQIISSVITLIEKGIFKKNYQLPSITALSEQEKIAKVTVAKAYKKLRQDGIIVSRQGKGYYITKSVVKNQLNIFVLFDTLNAYKEVLFSSFKNSLPLETQISIFFHNYNLSLFENLIINNLGNFNYYVIMPHFDEDVSLILDKIPAKQLIVLDKNIPQSERKFAAIFQNFEKDLFNALQSAHTQLVKYNQLNLVLGKDRFQYVPKPIVKSFIRFCKINKFAYKIFNTFEKTIIVKEQAYIIFSDSDMVAFIKKIQTMRLKLGKDIGLISYDETPLKEILMGGITVVTTDFEAMGKTAAGFITGKLSAKINNPFKLLIRKTL